MKIIKLISLLLLMAPMVVTAQQVDYNKIIIPQGVTNISYEERLVQLAWQNNPASHIARKEVEAAEHEVKAIGSQWTRQFGVTTNVNQYSIKEFQGTEQNDGLNFYPAYNVFLTIPLSTFFERPHLRKAAVQRHEISEDRVKQLKLSLRAEVLKLYNEYKQNENIWRIKRDALADEESNYLLVEERFKGGRATVEEYLLAQRSRNDQRIQVVMAETTYIKTKLDLESIIGVKIEEVR